MAGMAPPDPMAQDAKRLMDDDNETPNVSPEEQEAYEEFVDKAFELMYDGGQLSPKVKALLDNDPSDLIAILGENEALQQFSPQVAAAAAAAIVVLELVRQYGDSRPDDSVIFHAGRAVVEDMCVIAEKISGNEFDQDSVNRTFAMACDLYRDAAADAGMVNEDELAAAFDEVVVADKEGRLGEVVPQLDTLNKLAAADAEGAQADG